MRPSDKAWVALGLGVLSYQFAAIEDELMSEAADRYLKTHPWLTRLIVALVAAHLCNAIPPRLDPLCWLFLAKRVWKGEGIMSDFPVGESPCLPPSLVLALKARTRYWKRVSAERPEIVVASFDGYEVPGCQS